MPEEFGPHKEIINSIYQLSPETLEQVAQWIEQRGIRTPVSQVIGYQQIRPSGLVLTSGGTTTTSTSWVDVGAGTISGLRSGLHLFHLSAQLANNSALHATCMSAEMNGAPSGSPGFITGINFVFADGGITTGVQTLSTLGYLEPKSDTNSVKLYWGVSGGTGTLYHVSFTLLRLGTTSF